MISITYGKIVARQPVRLQLFSNARVAKSLRCLRLGRRRFLIQLTERGLGSRRRIVDFVDFARHALQANRPEDAP
jgi:hypothetical protein